MKKLKIINKTRTKINVSKNLFKIFLNFSFDFLFIKLEGFFSIIKYI
mgnify:CR=1 FL=1